MALPVSFDHDDNPGRNDANECGRPMTLTIEKPMSMYSQLLRAALGTGASSSDESNPRDALAELVRCRSRLSGNVSHEGSDWASAAVADELAYDIALIARCRSVGMPCDIGDFDNPRHGRARLEQAFESRGISLGSADGGIQACHGH